MRGKEFRSVPGLQFFIIMEITDLRIIQIRLFSFLYGVKMSSYVQSYEVNVR